MLKETSRYRFNKFLSELPVAKISYQADVTAADLSRIQAEMSRLARKTSLTVLVIENSTPKGIL